MDAFTSKRLTQTIRKHRESTGQLPTLKDLELAGFPKEMIETAKKKKLIEEFYVTLTNGAIVKGFKVKE